MPGRPKFEVSDSGEREEKSRRTLFEDLLRSQAVILMRKRGSNTLDETDFQHAWSRLLEWRGKEWRREAIGEVGVFGGGLLVASGSSLILAMPTAWEWSNLLHPLRCPGAPLLIAGLAVALLAIMIRHWNHN
jgi:hypothetical protein